MSAPAGRVAADAADATEAERRAEWRRKREERRERQRAQNVVRAREMHEARLAYDDAHRDDEREALSQAALPRLQAHVGCSGWFYWHWRNAFYPEALPRERWFQHYSSIFRTVELNAPFYSWPTLATVATWKRQVGRRRFTYTIKVNELITHTRRFARTGALVKDFGLIADLLGPRFGCFLFQLPPSVRYSAAMLERIVKQLDPARRNIVEFRHASWWRDRVFDAFERANIVFCSVSGMRLPDELVKTSDDVYLRFHGTSSSKYQHDYSDEELAVWAERAAASGAARVWAYFNNDRDCHAIHNAQTFERQLARRIRRRRPAEGYKTETN